MKPIASETVNVNALKNAFIFNKSGIEFRIIKAYYRETITPREIDGKTNKSIEAKVCLWNHRQTSMKDYCTVTLTPDMQFEDKSGKTIKNKVFQAGWYN